MTNTKPNFIYKFEKINSTQEEKERIIFEFIKTLYKLSVKNDIFKIKNTKERNRKMLLFNELTNENIYNITEFYRNNKS